MKRPLGTALLVLGGLLLAGCGLLEEVPVLPPDRAPEVRASAGEEREAIVLRWDPVERATYYEILRAPVAQGPYEPLDSTGSTSFTDRVGTENQGKWYWYKVRACNAAGCGPESAPVRGYAGRPPAPENVRATQGDFPDKIRVSWDPVPGATEYTVFRDLVEHGSYHTVVAHSVEETFVFDSNVRPATWYWYKVQAYNHSFGYSELSEAAGGYCGPRPIPFGDDEEPS